MTSYPVNLVLYDFRFFKYLSLSSCIHTEVVVHGKSIGYHDEHGITVMDREILDRVDKYNYKIRTIIPLGETFKTENDLKRLLQELNEEWNDSSFRLFNHNCRHFSKRLIDELQPSDSEEGIEILQKLISFWESAGTALIVIIRAFLMPHISFTTFIVYYFGRKFKNLGTSLGRLIKYLWNESCTVPSLLIIK